VWNFNQNQLLVCIMKLTCLPWRNNLLNLLFYFSFKKKKQATLRYMLQPELQKVLPRGISRLILVMMYFLLTEIYTVVQSNTWTNDPKLQGEKGGRAKCCRVCCMLGLLYFHFKVLTKLTEWANDIFLFLKQWGLRNGLRSKN